jgi:hypothetical protein
LLCIRGDLGLNLDPGTTLNEVFHGFPKNLLENYGTVSKIRPRLDPSASLPIHYSIIILSSNVVYSELPIETTNKTVGQNLEFCVPQ